MLTVAAGCAQGEDAADAVTNLTLALEQCSNDAQLLLTHQNLAAALSRVGDEESKAKAEEHGAEAARLRVVVEEARVAAEAKTMKKGGDAAADTPGDVAAAWEGGGGAK